MTIELLPILLGIICLYLGGEGLVRSSVAIAEKLKLPILLISSIIIGFGTSAPEFLVSLEAALKGYAEISIGNVVGSNISNTLLAMGVAAIISSIPCKTSIVRHDAIMNVVASLFLVYLSVQGCIHRLSGLVMIAGLITYLSLRVWNEKRKTKQEIIYGTKLEHEIKQEYIKKKFTLMLLYIFVLISLIFLGLGAHLLINGSVFLAHHFNIPEAVIGVTLVAISSSLPEIATACIASWHKHYDIVIGNILGSNLFNILSILGFTAFIKPIPFVGQIAQQDVWIMLSSSILLLLIICIYKKITRLWGISFIILYLIFILHIGLSNSFYGDNLII